MVNQNPPPKQRLYNLKEAALFLGRSPYSMRCLTWKGAVPVIQYPGERKQWFDLRDLEAFIERNRVVRK